MQNMQIWPYVIQHKDSETILMAWMRMSWFSCFSARWISISESMLLTTVLASSNFYFARYNYRQHCAQRKSAGIQFTQRPILRFFAPQGRHVAPMGVKFGMEEGTFRRSPPPCQISPPSVQRQGCSTPQNWNFYTFDQNVEYKRPAGAYPLRDFPKICKIWTPFQDALGVKIWLDLPKGLWSYGGFKLRGSVFPQIFSAP